MQIRGILCVSVWVWMCLGVEWVDGHCVCECVGVGMGLCV